MLRGVSEQDDNSKSDKSDVRYSSIPPLLMTLFTSTLKVLVRRVKEKAYNEICESE